MKKTCTLRLTLPAPLALEVRRAARKLRKKECQLVQEAVQGRLNLFLLREMQRQLLGAPEPRASRQAAGVAHDSWRLSA